MTNFKRLLIVITSSAISACATSTISQLPPVQSKDVVTLVNGYVCHETNVVSDGNETHLCFFSPKQVAPLNFTSPELREMFVINEFSHSCSKVEILSDSPFSQPERRSDVLQRVGLRCSH